MEELKVMYKGEEFTGYSALSVGDYSDHQPSDRGRANIEYMDENYPDAPVIHMQDIDTEGYTGASVIDESIDLGDSDVVKVKGNYSTEYYIRSDSDLCQEIGQALHNSPVIDDDIHARVQAEMKEEAFHDYGESDIRSLLSQDEVYPRINNVKLDSDGDFDIDDNLNDDQVKKVWDKLIEEKSGYDTFESTGYYIDVEAHKETVITATNDVLEEDAPKVKQKGPSLSM